MAKVTSLKVELQNGADSTVYATWSLANKYAKNLDHYKVVWKYGTGDGVAFNGDSSEITAKNATYNFPSNSTAVSVTVKPVSETYKKNGKETSYWTGESVTAKIYVKDLEPPVPNSPTILIEKYKLTATLEDIDGGPVADSDSRVDQIEFYVVKGNKKFKTGIVDVIRKRATFSCSVDAGGKYRVCARAINIVGKDKLVSAWSSYSSEESTIPASVKDIKCAAIDETSVKVTWTGNSSATSYEIEYTNNKAYFDSSTSVSSITVTLQHAEVTGLDPGYTWYFRVRAVNSQGESGWSSIISTVIGTKPEAPTTWSLSSTAIVGENVTLYWVHNTEDGSVQKTAQIELIINGSTSIVDYTDGSSDDDTNKVYSYQIDLSSYSDGAEILWRVRTKGIVDEYSDWSTQRTINLYAPPTLELHLGDDSGTLTKFPFKIEAIPGPNTQVPISYHVCVIADKSYEVEDDTGSIVWVTEGTEVYSNVFNLNNDDLLFYLLPSNVTLKNDESYTVTVTVSMNSGLIADATESFTVHWSDILYEPDAGVAIDYDTLSAYISPFCTDDSDSLISDITLSVYRREFDGGLTEIATELSNDGVITVTDPHPSLDYARYRIVAKSKSTSSIGHTDLPGEPVGEPSIVIQWDERWSEFDYLGEDEFDEKPWTGSMVKLPCNVDVNESNDIDTTLVEYIGRKHPVSYYGTQIGQNTAWSAEIPKSDKETIYALRRLSRWNGDVYVREPSGTGYWAQISVTMDIKHCEMKVPVSFSIKRVEGGA